MKKLVPIACLLIVALAPAASAEIYTINMHNGTSFDTRYLPIEAPFDSSMITFMSETGNMVALSKSDVADVTVLSEVKGFGTVIDTATIDLGIMPNDMPTEDEIAAQRAKQLSPFEETFARNYDQKQFVEPGDVGGGIPVFGVGGTGGGGARQGGSPLTGGGGN